MERISFGGEHRGFDPDADAARRRRKTAPLPPTASMLLAGGTEDGRAILTVLSSDVVVARTASLIAEMVGLETNLPVLAQAAAPRTLGLVGIALDLWASGPPHRPGYDNDELRMTLTPLTVSCLASLAYNDGENSADKALRAAAFALMGSLGSMLLGRYEPEIQQRRFDVTNGGEGSGDAAWRDPAVVETTRRLTTNWALPDELALAMRGPYGDALTTDAPELLRAFGFAREAAQAASLDVDWLPYPLELGSEARFLARAVAPRARRLSQRLFNALTELDFAA